MTSVPRIQVIHVVNVPDNRQLLSHPLTSSTKSLQLQRYKLGVIWNEIYVSHNKFKIFRDKFTSGLNVQYAWWHTRRMSTVLFINLINNTADGEGWRRFLVLSVVLCHDRPSSCTTHRWAYRLSPRSPPRYHDPFPPPLILHQYHSSDESWLLRL